MLRRISLQDGPERVVLQSIPDRKSDPFGQSNGTEDETFCPSRREGGRGERKGEREGKREGEREGKREGEGKERGGEEGEREEGRRGRSKTNQK